MKQKAWLLGFLILLTLFGSSQAQMCSIEHTPGATLLLPYFELDIASLTDTTLVTTLFSINNASDQAALAHVTLWTTWSFPSIDFDVYLTGYDIVTINLRDVFQGNLPVTSDPQSDPGDTISPDGPISQDTNFPNCLSFFPFENPVIGAANLERLQDGHRGLPIASIGNRCIGAEIPDHLARGYITVDSVSTCSTAFAGDIGYFIDGGLGIVNDRNILWGDYFIVDPANDFAFGDALVELEADTAFNAGSTPTAYTFYGRYAFPTGADNREPLGTTWGVRYMNGGPFSSGTDLIVWRDSTAFNLPNNGFVCGNESGAGPNWFPLNEIEVIGFDEAEDAVEICFSRGGGVISPPDPEVDPACFAYETMRYAIGEGDLDLPYDFGWLYLNLNLPPDMPTGDRDFGVNGDIAQSFVAAVYSAGGRYAVGLPALELTNACEDLSPVLNGLDVLPTFP